MVRINVGCGQSPTEGWRNFDNSPSLRIAKMGLLAPLLRKLGLLDDGQWRFVEFARSRNIEYADAARHIPMPDGTVEVLYTSHMLEHLDRKDADAFVSEARRVLHAGGILRIAVPDLKTMLERYSETGDADAFLEGSLLCVPRPRSLLSRFKFLILGMRHHQWLYDGESLCRLLERHGFVDAKVLPQGQTAIAGPLLPDLRERAEESVYVEAFSPANGGR